MTLLLRSRSLYLALGIMLVCAVVAVLGLRAYSSSRYSAKTDGINVGVWGRGVSYVISFSKNTNQYHVLSYQNSDTITIPGGLQQYRVGALGKVATLERDPLLLKKAMSQMSGLLLDGVVYQNTAEIFYDDEEKKPPRVADLVRDFRSRIGDSSDLGLLDRIYLYQKVGSMRTSNTQIFTHTKPQDLLFFDRKFRDEKRLIQIIYQRSQNTAIFLSHLLENIGIRVADISREDRGEPVCTVVEDTQKHSETALYLTRYFGCDLRVADTGLYEVIFSLGTETEQAWSL